MRFGLLATFISACAILAWDELKTKQRFPHPDVFVRAAIVWSVLGIISELGVPELAALFGLGFVLSMLYVYVKPTTGAPIETMGAAPGLGSLGPGWN